MKNTMIVLVALVVLGLHSNAQLKKVQDFIGRWVVAGEQNSGSGLEIIDSSTILLTYMGEKKKMLDYQFDFSKSPYWFDFTIQDSSSVMNVKSLLEIIGDSMIKWQLFIDEDRVPHFSSSKGELFYLKKAAANSDAVVSRSL